MVIHQVRELHLVDVHSCCYEAGEHLCPPHEAGSVEVYEGQTIEFAPMPYWYMALEGVLAVPVAYCPWCGERLALPGEAEDCSGIDFDKIGE